MFEDFDESGLGVEHFCCRSIFWSTIIFGSMKMIKMLRVSTEVPLSQLLRFSSPAYLYLFFPQVEFKGMDIVKHGESAYPAQVQSFPRPLPSSTNVSCKALQCLNMNHYSSKHHHPGVGGVPVQQGGQGRRKRPNEPCDGSKRRLD